MTRSLNEMLARSIYHEFGRAAAKTGWDPSAVKRTWRSAPALYLETMLEQARGVMTSPFMTRFAGLLSETVREEVWEDLEQMMEDDDWLIDEPTRTKIRKVIMDGYTRSEPEA